jgi:predicted transcriptional regulator
MIVRDDLHTLLDAIPEDRLDAAREALAALADPVLLALLTAPEDDEPLTEEDLQAIAEGEEDQKYGRTITLDEYIARRESRGRCRGE